MKTETIITLEQSIKAGNAGKNQEIKQKFVSREVFCNVNTLAEYVLSKSYEDSDAPFSIDDISNMYTYPEWRETVLGEDLYFGGGSEQNRDTFLEEFDRLTEASEELLRDEQISEATHEHNLELIEEAKTEVNSLETEPAEILEWYAVSGFLAEKLEEQGECVVDAGSCHIWGRQTSGQAILLDGVITRICADMGILEGQENAWL